MFQNPRPLAALSQILAERPAAFWQIFLTVVRGMRACVRACVRARVDVRGVAVPFSDQLRHRTTERQGAIELTIGKQDTANKAPGDIGFGSAFIPDDVSGWLLPCPLRCPSIG